MGIKETLEAIENAWLTVSDNGFPPYRLDNNGNPFTPAKLAECSRVISKNYNIEGYMYTSQPVLAYA